ncbi:hypothetical protein CIT292_07027 [Citrobacter youngae ATCC 29220]|uniref:Uncharacterized protein n=1 Tax=Citrobacter youngae ATCC 29220 TaxID=500640 RepID=D4B987_9ENTR|nr:hypothetical protein CIT292_07027 [Citrobacter youngae ATCC 29220]
MVLTRTTVLLLGPVRKASISLAQGLRPNGSIQLNGLGAY